MPASWRWPTTNDRAKQDETWWSLYDADGKRHFKKARYRTRRVADSKRHDVEDAMAAANLPNYTGGKESVTAWGKRWLAAKSALAPQALYRPGL